MTPEQFEKLKAVLDGEVFDPMPVGFIIDSPWLPGWAGISIMDYYASEKLWLEANFKAIETFEDCMFLPGFWSEYGMCTEPSAFGAKSIWQENEFPHADKVITSAEQIDSLTRPNPKTDGLLPFVLKRLQLTRPDIETAGHQIKFAVARGPLNIASFMMGTTEFLMALKTDADRAGKLVKLITDFTVDWLRLQKEMFPTIDGILVLDDIVGFCGKDDFEQFALPNLTTIYESFDAAVKFFHNDAAGLVCAPYLSQIGINLFNFSHQHGLAEMKELTGPEVTLLGNIAPRDVLAGGTADEVSQAVKDAIQSVQDRSRIILSAGGGMPPDVPSENIRAFLDAVS